MLPFSFEQLALVAVAAAVMFVPKVQEWIANVMPAGSANNEMYQLAIKGAIHGLLVFGASRISIQGLAPLDYYQAGLAAVLFAAANYSSVLASLETLPFLAGISDTAGLTNKGIAVVAAVEAGAIWLLTVKTTLLRNV
jgi:hypothetical protein